MYKRASRAMLHAHRVDSIDPAKGYVGGKADHSDILDSIPAMTTSALNAERDTLKADHRRWHAEMQAARAVGDKRRVDGIGSTMQVIQSRLSEIKDELRARWVKSSDDNNRRLIKLLREDVGEERFLLLAKQAKESGDD